MSAPDPKVVAMTEAECEVLRKAFAVWLLSPKTRTTLVSAAIPAVEQIVAARVAAVVEPVLGALRPKLTPSLDAADWACDPLPSCPQYAHVNPDWLREIIAEARAVRAAVESTDAPAALARVKAEALRGAAGECGERGMHAMFGNWLRERADRIEAEAGDPS